MRKKPNLKKPTNMDLNIIEQTIEDYNVLLKMRETDIENMQYRKPAFYRKKELEIWNEELNKKLEKLEELKNVILDLYTEHDIIIEKLNNK